MRNLIIAAMGLGCIACSGGGAKSGTAGRDSVIVAGPPAIPSTETPPDTGKAAAKTPPAPVKPAEATKSAAPKTASVPSGAQVDSVRGVVSVVGTSFDKHVMIAPGSGSKRVEVLGALSALIGHVAGTEVSVTGAMSGTQINASRFIVRSVEGQPAIDGTLRTEGGNLFIVTAEGTRTKITAPPPPLVGHDGARVWVTGDLAKGVSSFGFIDPPR
jgi:hypothetical protein